MNHSSERFIDSHIKTIACLVFESVSVVDKLFESMIQWLTHTDSSLFCSWMNQSFQFIWINQWFCSSESWTGSFIAGTAPPFSIKRCVNPASNWALFIKHSPTNTLEKLCSCPEQQTASTVYVTLGSSWSWTRLSFPHSSAAGRSVLMATLLLLLRSMRAQDAFFREKCPYKEFHHHLRQQEPQLKKLSESCPKPVNAGFTTKVLPQTRILISLYWYREAAFYLKE